MGGGAYFYLDTKSATDESIRKASNAAVKFGLYAAAYPIIKAGELPQSGTPLDSGVSGVTTTLEPLPSGDLCFIAKPTDPELKPSQANYVFYYQPDDKNPRISFAPSGVTECAKAAESLMWVSTTGDQLGLISIFNMLDGKRLTKAGEDAWSNFRASGNVFQQREGELQLLELKTDLYNLGTFVIKTFLKSGLTPAGLPIRVEGEGYDLWGGAESYFLQPGTVVQMQVPEKKFCISRNGYYLDQTLTEATPGACPVLP